MSKQIGIIFDMDGVIVDNADYHFISWRDSLAVHGIELTEHQYQHELNGRTLENILDLLFDGKMSDEQVKDFGEFKESNYREAYRNTIKPVPGLIDFLEEMQAAGIPCAIGTSAPTANVDFTLDETQTRRYFTNIIDSTMVTNSKPHPEVYLKAAASLNRAPENCVVFEDAMMGIEAGIASGAKTVGLSTTHSKEEVASANPHRVIPSFEGINLRWIKTLLEE